MDTPPPRVLVIGLDPHRVPGPWDPEPVASAIKVVVTVVREALRAHPWECVVGGGLRHDPDHVELLEQVINLIRELTPDAAIAFNTTPATTYEAAARWIR